MKSNNSELWTPTTLLASSSPRRKDLLSRLGIPFSAQGHDADETIKPGTDPEFAVRDLAVRKLRHVPELNRWDYILTADTIVCSPLDGRILGKPVDQNEAKGFLELLSGRQHRVLTGVCLYSRKLGTYSVEYAETAVEVSALSATEIAWYVETDEWRDAAGGYRIQDAGAAFVSSIHGSPSNVIGLPMRLVYSMLQSHRYPFR